MKIEYLGHSCFRIRTNDGVIIVTDPYTGVGYSLPTDLRADVVTVSHGHFDHNYTNALQGTYVLISETGTYTTNGITVTGIVSDHDPLGGTLRGKNIIYKITADGVTVCHLGDLGEACNQDLLANIGKVDILLVPVGGNYTIDASQAKEYVERICPKIAIPMHYRPQDGTIDITDATAFLSLYDKVRALGNAPFIVGNEIKETKDTQILYMERK